MTTYNVAINVEVHDEQELFIAAMERATNEGAGYYDALSMLKPDDEIDVHACLIMLADPGMSWPGTSILETYVESGNE